MTTVCHEIIMQQIWKTFNKSTHARERCATKIHERENIEYILNETLSLSLVKINRNKKRFFTKIYNGNFDFAEFKVTRIHCNF